MADAHELFLLDGNSLAYRAYFALPESIATADGRPTNAIYGLASMLVKIIDEHRPAGVVVAWDAGMSGREVAYKEYKAAAAASARPASRAVAQPDAAGRGLRLHQRQGRGVRGRRRDRLAGAAGAGAGDSGDGRLRRPRRLPDGRRRDPGDEHLAGDHRDQGLRPRGRGRALRGAAGADHRPDGPAGRHLRQHPRRPRDRREDGDAAAAESSARWRRCWRTSTRSPAPSADRTWSSTPTTPASPSSWRRSSTTSRPGSTWPRRWRPSPTAPLCASSCASSSCARSSSGSRRRSATRRRCRAAGWRRSWRSRRSRDRPPISPTAPPRWRSPAIAGPAPTGSASSPGASTLDELAVALAGRPLVAHDAKSLGGGRHGLLAAAAREGVELRLDHDTMVAAYLLEPQRRTYDLTELAADAGIGLAEEVSKGKGRRRRPALPGRGGRRGGPRPCRRGAAGRRSGREAAAPPERAGAGAPAARRRAAARPRPRRDGARRAEARRRAPRRGRRRLRRADRHPGEGDLRAGRARVHDRLPAAGRPASSSRSSA